MHKQFEVKHIHQLTPAQVGEAVEYYFEQYSWMRGLDDKALSAPWRYPADMLVPNGDNPNPLGKMLGEMRQMGYEVEAALFQLLSLQRIKLSEVLGWGRFSMVGVTDEFTPGGGIFELSEVQKGPPPQPSLIVHSSNVLWRLPEALEALKRYSPDQVPEDWQQK
ncbi:hypothetical protein WH277_17390 [Erwinia sp. MYb416]